MKRIPRELLARMAESVSPEDRDEMAIPSYLHANPLMRWMAWHRLEVVVDRFRSLHGPDAAATVMDFGCGTGVLFDEASQAAERVYGVDIVLEPARLLIDEWGLDKVRLMTPDEAEAEVLPDSVDTVIAAEVLEHIEPLDSTLAFFRRCLKPNGTLLVSLPTENAVYRLGRRLAGFHGHYHESNAASIHELILGAGFEPLSLTKIPLPGPLAIYWIIAYRMR